jgi:alginate O-acetyltransferase complex protein AlgI
MLFNSFTFLAFFILVTGIYFVIPSKLRMLFLLAASCFFYMFFVPIYIVILAGTIVVDYFAGIFIENSEGKKKKWFLIASLVTNIGVLAVFKYYNFFLDNAYFLFHGPGYTGHIPYLSILLPIGLSFHTFQAMSYTIEVYRGNQKAERQFDVYALYIMFYPQLVAGPIERPQNILWQLKKEFHFDYNMVVSGLRLMLWGAFKKIVIADRLAPHVNDVYNNLPKYSGPSLILATVFFSIQIYCDFSGYSDIAIGAARVMGIDLMKNFDRPYSSKSISEYWTRWHISLTTWFRDYIFYPLSMSLSKNRGHGALKLYINLFIVFLISGLWHGANWTFVIWGALHGFYLVFAIVTKNIRDEINTIVGLNKFTKLRDFLAQVTTFALVSFALIFFRAKNFHDAFYVITHLFRYNGLVGIGSMHVLDFFIVVSSVIILEIVQYIHAKNNIVASLTKRPLMLRWTVYAAVAMAIIFFGNFGNEKFIYFQF